MRPPARTTETILLGALSLALLLGGAGCGASDDRRDREEIRQVLTDSMNAAHAGDRQKACSLYTRAYVRETLKESRGLKVTGDGCEELVRALEPVLRQLTADPSPRVTDVRLSGDEATARMEIETHFGPAASKLFLVRADGKWKINHDRDLRDGT